MALLRIRVGKRKDVSPGVRIAVWSRDGLTCQYCGLLNPPSLSIDHVIPRSLGGSDSYYNLVTACFKCNSIKSVSVWIPSNIDDIGRTHPEWADLIVFLANLGSSPSDFVDRWDSNDEFVSQHSLDGFHYPVRDKNIPYVERDGCYSINGEHWLYIPDWIDERKLVVI